VVQVGLPAQLLRGEGLVPVEVVAVLRNGRGCNGRGRGCNGFLHAYVLRHGVRGHCRLGVRYLVPRGVMVLWYMEGYYGIIVYI
jgi:hypothetical protein